MPWGVEEGEFEIDVRVINVGSVPVTIDRIRWVTKRSAHYARTIKKPGFRDPMDTIEFLKHRPFQYMRHKLLKYTGYRDRRVKLYSATNGKDTRPRLQDYGDEWTEEIKERDHTMFIEVSSVTVLTSTGVTFRGKRIGLL